MVRARGLPLVLLVTACNPALLPLVPGAGANNETQVAAVPVEDGSHYVSVITSPRTSANLVRRRWLREVATACEGDYMVLSENAALRRTGAMDSQRLHEGFVRCVSPESTIRDQDKPTTDRGRSVAGVRRR